MHNNHAGNGGGCLSTELILGIFGGVVTIVVALIGIIPKIKEIKAKKKESNDESVDKRQVGLDKHPVFLELKSLEYFFTYDFRLKDAGRIEVVKEATLHKLRTASEILYKYAKQVMEHPSDCITAKSNEEIAIILMNLFTEMTDSIYKPWYKTGTLSICNKVYDERSVATMDIYLDKYRQWNQTRIEIIKTATLELPRANMGDSCYNTMWDMMSIYMYVYIQMKYDAVTTIKRLNGELTGHYFLGIKLGDV